MGRLPRLLTGLIALVAPRAGEAASLRVLVKTVRSAPELATEAMHLTESLLVALGKRDGVTVIGDAELDLLLAHEGDKRDLEACTQEASCLAKLETVVDAEKMMTTQLARWGDAYLVTVSLSDLRSASLERGESCQGETVEEVERCGTELAGALLGGKLAGTDAFKLAEGRLEVAVLDLEAYGAGAELAKNLTQLLALELKKIDGLSVISRDEVAAALAYEVDRQVVTCTSDVSCLIEIGGALGVESLVMGAVGKLGETFVIHLKLLRAETGEVLHRVSESYRGPERHLGQALRFAVRHLIGRRLEGTGELSLALDADGASLSIDGAAAHPLGAGAPPATVSAGKHTLVLAAPDFHRLSEEFYVEPGATTTLHPELVPLPRAWYRQWWPWAIIGAAVAAAVTTSIVLGVDAPENGRVDVQIESTDAVRFVRQFVRIPDDLSDDPVLFPMKRLARSLLFGWPMKEQLDWLADQLIQTLCARDPEIAEGFVRTVGPPGYRRLDYRNRALAYVRSRPKKAIVRIDVPGIWRGPLTCSLSMASANGWALALRTEHDVPEAVQAILTAVEHERLRRGWSSR